MSAVHVGKRLNTVPREAVGSAVFPRVRAHFGAAKFASQGGDHNI